jgi:DNA-binding HxlR family transcriptional regulator
MSPSVLYERLRELTDARLVESTEHGYRLTSIGQQLGTALKPLDRWARRWSNELENVASPRPRAPRDHGRNDPNQAAALRSEGAARTPR